jgi:hypothetical protein
VRGGGGTSCVGSLPDDAVDSEETAPLDVAENRPERRKHVSVCTWHMWERRSESNSTQQAMLRSVVPCLDKVKGKGIWRGWASRVSQGSLPADARK